MTRIQETATLLSPLQRSLRYRFICYITLDRVTLSISSHRDSHEYFFQIRSILRSTIAKNPPTLNSERDRTRPVPPRLVYRPPVFATQKFSERRLSVKVNGTWNERRLLNRASLMHIYARFPYSDNRASHPISPLARLRQRARRSATARARTFLLFLGRSLSLERHTRLTFSPERHPVSSADGCAANKIFHETSGDSASPRRTP